MRFIHAADIHLDSPLIGLSSYADAPLDMLRGATRQAFTNLVTAAVDEAVDFMVIAGDLYDGSWKDHNTGLYFVQQMGRLNRAGIPVYLLYGNHDAESQMTKKLLLPENVHVFESRKATTFVIPGSNVALHGRSFKEAATTDNLAASYPDPIAGMYNIGVLHTALEGESAHANYAPCSLAELQAKGYDYWALGHVHEYSVWRQDALVVFPGNLQGRHIRETGPKGAVLVDHNELDGTTLTRLYVDVLRWQSIEIDVSESDSFTEVARLVGSKLEELTSTMTDERAVVVRVVITGRTAAHGELFGLENQLRLEVLGQVAALGDERLWLEKVKLQTAGLDVASHEGGSAALDDLQLLLASAKTDTDFLASLQADLLNLVNKSPHELHGSVPYFKSIRAGELDELLDDVGPALMARLARQE